MRRLDPAIGELRDKMKELKKQYDLFIAGQRRTEPTWLLRQVERELLELTRDPSRSTMVRFQLRTIGNQFHALQTQIRNLMELRMSRRAANVAAIMGESGEAPVNGNGSAVIVDKLALKNPELVVPRVRTLLKKLEASKGEAAVSALSAETLCQVFVQKAKSAMNRPDVSAVRFSVVKGEAGPKIKGEVILKRPRGETDG